MTGGTKKRALIVARLSRLNEVSESIDRQVADCKTVCDRYGWEVVGIAQDVNVSAGKTSPFERPELRDWIGDGQSYPGRAHEIDVIVFWRVDRIARNMIHLMELMIWADQHGIQLKSATEDHFDTGSTFGKAIASLVASFAEMELEAIRERVTSDKQHRLAEGAFVGGVPVWGYEPYRDEQTGMMKLRPDPNQVRQIKFAVAGLFDGKSLHQIARELTEAGELTSRDMNRKRRLKPGEKFVPRFPEWSSVTIKNALSNPALMGYAVKSPAMRDSDGKPIRDKRGEKIYGDPVPVRDAEGNPVMRGEPILTREEFVRVQGELETRSRTRQVNKRSDSLLLGVVLCGVCGRRAYKQRHTDYEYYVCSSYQNGGRCSQDRSVMVQLSWLEEYFTDTFLRLFGGEERAVREWDPGEEHEERVSSLEEQIAEQAGALTQFRSGSPAFDAILKNLHELENERDRLLARGTRRAGWVWVGTGETVSQWWERATTKQRNTYLRECGIQLAYRKPLGRKRKPRPEVDITFPELELVEKTLADPSSPLFGLWGEQASHGEQLLILDRLTDTGEHTMRMILRAAPETEEYPVSMMDPALELDQIDADGVELTLGDGGEA